MDFKDCQHVIYRHTDTEHDHIHVVASRTRLTDGTTVSDSWDYKRSAALVRQLEKAYNLAAVEPKDRGIRAQTTGEFRQLQRTGGMSIRERLKFILQTASADSPSMPQFVQRVLAAGVEVRTAPGKNRIRGISYALENIAFSGTHIGRDYTFPGLQRHRGIDYDSTRDDAAIAQLIERGPQLYPKNESTSPVDLASEEAVFDIPIESTGPYSVPEVPAATANSIDVAPEFNEAAAEEGIELYRIGLESAKRPKLDPLQKRCAEAIAPIAIALLKLMHQNGEVEAVDSTRWKYTGDRYAMTYDKTEDIFSLEALDSRGELLRIGQSQSTDTILDARGIGEIDVDNFYRIEQMLLQKEQVAVKPLAQQFIKAE